MRELTRSVGLLSLQRVLLAGIGVLRTKVAAKLLGPSGVGLLAQALSLQEFLRALATLGSSNGFLKLVAEQRGREDWPALARLIGTTITLLGSLAITIAAICALFSRPIAARVFDDPSLAPLVALTAASAIFLVPGGILMRVFPGCLDLRSYVQAGLVVKALGVVVLGLLTWRYELRGAVMALVATEAGALVIVGLFLWWRILAPNHVKVRLGVIDWGVARQLLRLAGALSLTSLAATAAGLVVRAQIIRRSGADANGYYQLAWQVGQNYLGFLGTALWSYGMPKVATQLHDPDSITKTQNDFLRIALVLLLPGVVVLLASRNVWIPILFTREFLAAGPILCWQLAGEVVAMLRQAMNISLLPRERLGFLVFQAVAYWLGWVALATVLMPRLGVEGVSVAYLVANGAMLVLTYAYHSTQLGFAVRPENRLLLAQTVPGFALAIALLRFERGFAGRVAPLLLVAIWLVVTRRIWIRLLRARGALWSNGPSDR